MKAKDFLGREIHVGDKMVYVKHTRTSVWLKKVQVLEITEKSVLAEVLSSTNEYGRHPTQTVRIYSTENCVLYTD
jgi:hypothetical protein